MENDTSINRTSSSNSNTSVFHKKPNSEKIDISQLSFFDELLSIGQFDSNIPEAVGLPIEQPTSSDRGPENKSVEQTRDEADSGKLEASTDSSAEQSAYAVLALAQQQLPSQPQSLDLDGKSDKQKRNQPVANATPNENSGPALPSALTTSNGPSAPASLASSVDGTASAESDFLNVNSEPEVTAGDGDQQPIGHLEDLSHSKPILKAKASTNKREAKADQDKSPETKLNLNPDSLQPDSKPEPTSSHSQSKQSEDHGNTDDVNANTSQPRNKRAERLAQRASESDHTSDEHDSSSASAQAIEPLGPLAASEIHPDESLLSVTGSVSTSSSISNFSPLIAPSISTGNHLTSTSTIDRPSVEGISATTTRGGIQTNASTTFSGTTATSSNPARAEGSGAEVARSSTGSRISAYQEVKLVQRVLRGVEQLASGGGQVRLRLHPPELGSLQMSLRMEAGQVFAKLEVENSTARDALLNNIQTLRDRLAEQGMKVATFEVEVSTDSTGSGTSGSNFQKEGGSESQSRWDHATSRFAQQNNNRISSEPAQPERKSGAVWTRKNGSLDLTV